MNGRTAAILVGILALLSVLVVLTTPNASAPMAGQDIALLNVPPSQIGAIRVTDGSRAVAIEKGDLWGGWFVTQSNEGEGDRTAQRWPASEATVSAGVRVLANAVMRREQTAPPESQRTVVVEDTEGNQLASLTMGDQSLGGRVSATMLGGQSGTIERELASFLSPDSLLGWRDTALLPGLDAGVVALSIAREGETLSLRRVGSAWSLESPVREPADTPAVQALIEKLILSRSERFVDTPVAEGALTLVVESGATGDRRRYTARLDPGASICEVTLEGTKGGVMEQIAQARHAVSADVGLALDIAVTDLVSKRSIPTPASEVAALTLSWDNAEPRVLQRTSEGWTSREDKNIAEAWLTVLTSAGPSSITLSTPEANPYGVIKLTGFGDLDMGSCQVRIDHSTVWIARDKVWRAYKLDAETRTALTLP